MQPPRICAAFVAMLLLLPGGCGPPAELRPTSPVETRLELLAEFLGMYVVEFGRRPADDAAFREYVEDRGRARLQESGIGSIDELFTSPRDGRQFVVLYDGEQYEIRGEIWAFEAEGDSETRAVVDSLGIARLMPENDFQRLRSAGP